MVSEVKIAIGVTACKGLGIHIAQLNQYACM